jgi:hypothetical protein
MIGIECSLLRIFEVGFTIENPDRPSLIERDVMWENVASFYTLCGNMRPFIQHEH